MSQPNEGERHNNLVGVDLKVLMDAMTGNLRNMMREELEPMQSRIDALENSRSVQPVRGGVHARRERAPIGGSSGENSDYEEDARSTRNFRRPRMERQPKEARRREEAQRLVNSVVLIRMN